MIRNNKQNNKILIKLLNLNIVNLQIAHKNKVNKKTKIKMKIKIKKSII